MLKSKYCKQRKKFRKKGEGHVTKKLVEQKLTCALCSRPFKYKQKYIRHSNFYYHVNCHNMLYIDLPNGNEPIEFNLVTANGGTISTVEVV